MEEKKTYKIALCGPSGVGKTTLVEVLEHSPLKKEFNFIYSNTKILRDQGYNEEQITDYVLKERIAYLDSKHLNCICDRSIIDTYAYLDHLPKTKQLQYTTKIFFNMYKYDLIIFLLPEKENKESRLMKRLITMLPPSKKYVIKEPNFGIRFNLVYNIIKAKIMENGKDNN